MPQSISDPQRPISTGNSLQAQTWVKASSLSAAAKRDLLLFIQHFPTLTFFRDKAGLQGVSEDGYPLPSWLKTLRRTLTYVMPEDYVLARFDAVAEDDAANWFTLYVGTYLKDVAYIDLERQLHADGLPLQLIGERIDIPGTALAVYDENPNTQAIYQFNLETLSDFKQNQFPLSSALEQIFVSYPDMLSHIECFKIGQGAQQKEISRVNS